MVIDFIANLPGWIGELIGSGIWLIAISRLILLGAPKLQASVGGLLLANSLTVAGIVGFLAAGGVHDNLAKAAALNAIGGGLLLIWDSSRLRRRLKAVPTVDGQEVIRAD